MFAAHVRPWLDLVHAYRARVEASPGLATIYATDALDRAQRVCEALLAGSVAIAARFDALEGGSAGIRERPPAATEAARDRSAMLMLAARAALEGCNSVLSKSGGCVRAELSLDALMARIGNAEWTAPIVLSPARVRPKDHHATAEVGPAQGIDEMETYFGAFLPRLLADLDGQYAAAGTRFAQLLPGALALSSEQRYAQWCRAWGRSVAAVATEWMLLAGGGTVQGAAAVLWRGCLPRFRGRGEPPRGALPTADKYLEFDLHAAPLLCQLLHHDDAHWKATGSDRSRVRIRMPALDYESRRSRVFYRGRNVGHLYLTVWLEHMAVLLAGHAGTTAMTPQDPPAGLPPALADALVPGHYESAAALVALLGRSAPLPSAPPNWWAGSRHAAAPPGATPAEASLQLGSPAVVRRLEARHVVTHSHHDDLRDDCVGRMYLPWALLDGRREARWLDVALIVRWQGRWSVLDAELEDELSAKDDRECVAVLLRPAQRTAPDMQALRRAWIASEWAFRNDRLGVFLTGVVDLDSPA